MTLETFREDILLEIGCEELPPKNLQKLSEAFTNGIKQQLSKAEFMFDDCKSFVSPRRLAVFITQVISQQPDRKMMRKGPAKTAAFDKDGNPTPAALGFAKACGVSISEVSLEETAKGAWLIYEQTEIGKSIVELMPDLLKTALFELPVPRTMRWGNYDFSFVRPVHWILALYGKKTIPIHLFDLNSGNTTRGHRFLCKADSTISLSEPKDYEKNLEDGFVIADFTKRKAKIKSEIEKAVAALESNSKAIIEEDLLNEVTGLVEWPVVLIGSFDPEFLKIPQEALISAMKIHQKSFPIIDAKANLSPKFVIVSNLESSDPTAVIRGNESVMRARLSDAAFYYRIDKDVSLLVRRENLKQVVFQKDLGSLWDKTQRVAHLAKIIANIIQIDTTLVERAAHLAKSDLLTQMVGEFPELQGIMGRYYALHDGEPNAVANAIEEHYLPRFASDELPHSHEGAALSIADRIDTLVGLFILGKKPTGDKDPFGLRRQAFGMLRIILEKQYDLDLKLLIHKAIECYKTLILKSATTAEEILDFCYDRLRAFYSEQKISPRVFEAVLAKKLNNPNDFNQRILAVHTFQTLPEAESLAESNKRVHNILTKAELTYPSLNLSQNQNFDFEMMKEIAEQVLANAIILKGTELKPLLEHNNYTLALKSLASLKTVIDTFFNECMVMVDDPIVRNNRLKLLNALRNLFLEIADISLL